jgi:hypothetical protein
MCADARDCPGGSGLHHYDEAAMPVWTVAQVCPEARRLPAGFGALKEGPDIWEIIARLQELHGSEETSRSQPLPEPKAELSLPKMSLTSPLSGTLS